MRFLSAVHTDVGIRKSTNQDSALLMEANTEAGSVLLSIICDGMGGLAKGELASATVIQAFSRWFENDLPPIVNSPDPEKMIFAQWQELILECNRKIAAYAGTRNISMGTTLNGILFMNGRYYAVNVGDSRAYLLTDALYQLSKDHSFVQREVDMGRMTPEEALTSPRRNVLLQCVGASRVVAPDFTVGEYAPGQVFMQCSDGFRHAVTPEELYEYLNPDALTDEQTMHDNAVYLTELNKNRRETDNITVLLVKVV